VIERLLFNLGELSLMLVSPTYKRSKTGVTLSFPKAALVSLSILCRDKNNLAKDKDAMLNSFIVLPGGNQTLLFFTEVNK